MTRLIHRAALLVVCLAAAASASDIEKTFRNVLVSVPKLPAAPTVDGTVDPEEWRHAGVGPRLLLFEGDDRLTDETQRFYFGYTDDAFYMAWQLQRPKYALAPKAIITQPDHSFFRTDDAIEFMLNCTPEGVTRQRGRDFYMLWNALGTKYDRREWWSGETADMTWTSPWKAVSRTKPDFGWEGEYTIPLESLEGAIPPAPGVQWVYQLCENQSTPYPRVALQGFQLDWFWSRDYANMIFTGAQGVYARVLECGSITEQSRGGLVLELVNPGGEPRTVVPALRMYKRKANPGTTQSYLTAFDQSRDRAADLAGTGKVALFIPDDKLSQNLVDENYDPVMQQNDPVTLSPGERKVIDFTIEKKAGDYLAFYDVQYVDGQAPDGASQHIAGAPLPFLIPEPLAVELRPFFLMDKSIEADVDLRYVTGWQAAGTIAAKLTDAAGNTLYEKQWPGNEYPHRLSADIDIAGVAPGDCTLTFTVTDPAGKQLARRQSTVTIPQTPDWYANPVGMSPRIAEPFTPIETEGRDLHFVMGNYKLGDTALPRQINVNTVFDEGLDNLLRGPATFTGVVNGEAAQWSGDTTLTETTDEKVTATSTAEAAGVRARVTNAIEYDGMEKITLTLEPTGGAVTVNRFTLSIPIKAKYATLYRQGTTHGVAKVRHTTGTLPAEGVAHDWASNVWIGNERRGLSWFAENWKGWHIGRDFETEIIEVTPDGDGMTLNVHFIRSDAKPLTLDKPREIIFGLMFTPMRPLNRQTIHHGYSAYQDDINRLEAEIAAGVNVIETWQHRPYQGWWDQSPKRVQEILETHKPWTDRGVKVTPYSGWYLSRKAEVYPTYGAEMVVEPNINAGCGCDTCCWNSPVTDAYLHTMKKSALEANFAGFRMDAGFSVASCSSLKHHGEHSQCGWVDDRGRVQPSFAIFAAREAAKRAYRMFHGGEITEDGLCIHHVHFSCRFPAIMSHMDAVLSAEGAERNARTIKEFDLSFWRAGINGDAWGVQVVYGPKSDHLGWNSRLGLGLIHHLTPRGGPLVSVKEQSYSRSAPAISSIWLAENWVGHLDKNLRFFGYWENAQLLDTSDPDVKATVYYNPDKRRALLGALNLHRKAVRRTITIDLPSLDSGLTHAVDGLTGEPIELDAGLAFTIDLKPEGYRMIKFAAEPFEVATPKIAGDNLIPEMQPSAWPDTGIPTGWTKDNDAAWSAANGELILAVNDNHGQFRKSINLEPGKTYMLEVEARIAPGADGTYLGPLAADHHFGVTFGEYYGTTRTLTSEGLPGQYETMCILYTPTADNPSASIRIQARGDGKVHIRNIGVYAVDLETSMH